MVGQGGYISNSDRENHFLATDMLKKFRAYYHFIKRQKRHRETLGVHPIRAVLIETTDEARGRKLMDLVNHPLVCEPGNRVGLFWFTISPLFADRIPAKKSASGLRLSQHLENPAIVLDPIWAMPDQSNLSPARRPSTR